MLRIARLVKGVTVSRIDELESEIARLRDAERAAIEEQHKKQCAAFAALPYEWKVTKQVLIVGSSWFELGHLFPSYPKGATIPTVYVQRRKSGYDPTVHGCRPDAEKWDGMCYARSEEGVLVRYSGGTYVLLDCLLISDDEWQSLQSGNVPERLKRQ